MPKNNYSTKKTNKKLNKKSVISGILLVVLLLAAIGAAFGIATLKVDAATNRAGSYTISGSYNIGDGSVSGYMSDFRISISTQYFTDDSATVAQTKYNYHTYDWTYFSFYMNAGDVKEHQSVKMTRNC